jgi:hypothetical protein
VLLGTTAFVCVLFWPLVVHLGSTIAGDPGSDATASVAWFWNAQHEGCYHLLGTTHHTLSGSPFGWDGTNALNIQVALAYYPTYLAAHVVGQVAAFNLTTLAGYILSGASMYLLTRYLGCRALVSAWAALAYIVFPWHLARVEHASLLHIEVLALLIIALVAVVRRRGCGSMCRGESRLLADTGVLGPMAAVSMVAFASARRWRREAAGPPCSLTPQGTALVAPAFSGSPQSSG